METDIVKNFLSSSKSSFHCNANALFYIFMGDSNRNECSINFVILNKEVNPIL